LERGDRASSGETVAGLNLEQPGNVDGSPATFGNNSDYLCLLLAAGRAPA